MTTTSSQSPAASGHAQQASIAPRPREIGSICVYCGTGSAVSDLYKDAARDVGQLCAAAGIRLVYGGGSVGLMGIVSESCMKAGGKVLGIIPGHITEREVQKHDITELVVVKSMHERKAMMVEKSDGFIVLPGGMGTLDETFEILTWKYLGLHDKPVVFLNVDGFYDPLLAMIEHMNKEGFTPESHLKLFSMVNTAEDALAVLAARPAQTNKVLSDRL